MMIVRVHAMWAAVAIAASVSVGCGDDGAEVPAATTATTAEQPTTSEDVSDTVEEDEAEAPYAIVEDASYLGVIVGSTEPVEAYDDPERGEWIFATGPVGDGIVMYRRQPGGDPGDREDLAVSITPGVAVDAIRLTGDTSEVHLGLSCAGGAVVLVASGPTPMDSTQHEVGGAIRAWRPGPDGTLEEFDPDESTDPC